jgi:hypothetical protein
VKVADVARGEKKAVKNADRDILPSLPGGQAFLDDCINLGGDEDLFLGFLLGLGFVLGLILLAGAQPGYEAEPDSRDKHGDKDFFRSHESSSKSNEISDLSKKHANFLSMGTPSGRKNHYYSRLKDFFKGGSALGTVLVMAAGPVVVFPRRPRGKP